MTDVHDRFRSLDRVPVPELWGEATQRSVASPGPARVRIWRTALALGVTGAVIVVALGGAVAIGSGLVELPGLVESPPPSAEPTFVLVPAELPPPLPGPSGVYGTTIASGSMSGMHSVVQEGSGFRQTQIVFAVESECFGPGRDPVPVTVAGLNGLYLEPYKGPSMTFLAPRGGERTGAYALPIDGRTLCVYLTWDPATTPDELAAARQVVESIRGRAVGPGSIQINFTLPAGWDTG